MATPSADRAARFQALVENSADALALLDTNGRILYVSRGLEHTLGYAPEEQIERSGFALVHEDDLPLVAEAFARGVGLRGIEQTVEFRARHKDGSWRDMEATVVNRLSDPAVGAVVVNYRDVSERKHAAAALAASEARLRRFIETAQDLIYTCDPAGRFTYANPTACRVMKYAESELVGRHFLMLVRPDFEPAVKDLYRRQIEERTPDTYFEFAAVAKDGSTIWVGQHVQLVVENDRVTGVQAIARDISAQKSGEEQLRRSEARYRSLIQGAAHGIYRTTVNGEILDANPAFASMLGFGSVEEVRAVNMRDIYVRPAERLTLIDKVRATGASTLSEEVSWRRKDGTPIGVRITAHMIADFEGSGVTCFEGIAEDITERRALEEQLRQSQKMEAVGRLARGIAHDFNNVLAAILGNADLLQLQLAPHDPMRADILEIGAAAERGASLTRQLMAFSRRQSTVPEVVDLHGVVRGFDTMLRRLSGDVDLRLHTNGPAPRVMIEPGQIEQIVMNLVVNARDAVREGGRIDVTTDTVTVVARDVERYPGVSPGFYARLAVQDTGDGISPAIEPHVFEPFFTTKDPAKGNGLGLSIVYGIAKEAGGSVTFSSSAGSGTTFEVLLPLAGSA